MTSPTKDEVRQSHYVKLMVYARFIREKLAYIDSAHALLEEAEELFISKNDSRLRAMAQEVDVLVREVLDPPQQVGVISEMKSGGVLRIHLPKLPTLRRLRTILKHGLIRSHEDFIVARSAMDTGAFGQLSEAELFTLGKLFDDYAVKGV